MNVTIVKGTWRNQEYSNITLPFLDEGTNFRHNNKGMYVKCDPSYAFPFVTSDSIRIFVDSEDQVVFNSDQELTTPSNFSVPSNNTSYQIKDEPIDGDSENESEQETMDRIESRFNVLQEMTNGSAMGVIKGLIVSGAPGTGKSYGVEQTLEENCAGNFELFKGSISPTGLYTKLYEFSEKGSVFVLDDSDDVFGDYRSLSLLKTVLDTGSKRYVSWLSDANFLKENDIPSSFEFRGSVIFITNMDLERSQSKTLRPHFDALISRSHFLDLTIRTQREKFLRIKSLVRGSEMLRRYDLPDYLEDDILKYMKTRLISNEIPLRELSLRTVLKIADLAAMSPLGWRNMADVTI